MPAPNPFVYGEIVPRAAFADREVELHRLVSDLGDGQKVFLISPRRYGKSSLVRQALAVLERQGVATLEVSVSSYSSYVAFLEGYTQALAALAERTDAARSWLREWFSSTAPSTALRAARSTTPGAGLSTAAPSTSPGSSTPRRSGTIHGRGGAITFPAVRTPRDAARLAEEVFALPGKLAARLNRRLVIALDEFQAIGSFGLGNVEDAMRAAIQQQRQVGYVFAGSEPSLMEQMIGPRRPFFKAGPVLRLGKIPADVFAVFVESRFKKSGIRPETGLGSAIVDLAGNLPYDVQRLAHETWDDVAAMKRRVAGVEDLHATLHRLLAEQDTFFEAVWQRLTLLQRAVLRAVVLEQGIAIFGADIRERHRLGVASSVQTSLAALQREDIIAREDTGRYTVIDSLMREWVARTTF